MDKETGKVVRRDIISRCDKDKPGEVAHGVHQISFSSIVSDLAWCPEIDVENVERAAERPRKDELAVAGDSSIGSDAMRAL